MSKLFNLYVRWRKGRRWERVATSNDRVKLEEIAKLEWAEWECKIMCKEATL